MGAVQPVVKRRSHSGQKALYSPVVAGALRGLKGQQLKGQLWLVVWVGRQVGN